MAKKTTTKKRKPTNKAAPAKDLHAATRLAMQQACEARRFAAAVALGLKVLRAVEAPPPKYGAYWEIRDVLRASRPGW